MYECFCGEAIMDGLHVLTGSLWCFPDEPETLDAATPVEDAHV